MTTFDWLTLLLGTWVGFGKGMFPTIDSFDYSETFIVRPGGDGSYLTYEQDTELIDAEGRPIRKSHWEAGVIRLLEDGAIEIVCVHGSGRIEILRSHSGSQESTLGRLSLHFVSELVANDDRVKSSTREWFLTGGEFRYKMRMATSKVDQLTVHLDAILSRLSPD